MELDKLDDKITHYKLVYLVGETIKVTVWIHVFALLLNNYFLFSPFQSFQSLTPIISDHIGILYLSQFTLETLLS